MSLGWVDASAGVAGDMLLGALLDAGAPMDAVQGAVTAVAGETVRVSSQPASRAGLRATRAVVTAQPVAPARTWRDVRAMLDGAALDDRVRARALGAFARLAEAEGRVHGTDPEGVHFHEVGALDAIADVVGCCAAVAALGVEHVVAGVVAVGSGRVATEHGDLPVPVPAVVELLRGAPTMAGGTGELATPTGAALLAELADTWGDQPPMRPRAQGVGAGSRDPADRPNVVRVVLGDPVEAAGTPAYAHSARLLEANVDDLDPRLWPEVITRLLQAGAADAWLVPILMKKGRPAHTLCALVDDASAAAVRATIFRETSSIGVRETRATKHALPRAEVSIDVSGQPIRVKVAWDRGVVVNVQPEWEDVAAAARALGRPTKDVLAGAVAAARNATQRTSVGP